MKDKNGRVLVFGLLLALLPPVSAFAGEGLAALQTADPACPDDSGDIYVDCENGTVTDNRTGLVWLADATCWDVGMTWEEAKEIVAGLSDIPPGSAAANDDCGLSDNSSPGEWRLPSVSEWEDMISNALGQGGDPDCTGFGKLAITNDAGTACWSAGGSSFSGLYLEGTHWASTTQLSSATAAWRISLHTAMLQPDSGSGPQAWPVRGGQ